MLITFYGDQIFSHKINSLFFSALRYLANFDHVFTSGSKTDFTFEHKKKHTLQISTSIDSSGKQKSTNLIWVNNNKMYSMSVSMRENWVVY